MISTLTRGNYRTMILMKHLLIFIQQPSYCNCTGTVQEDIVDIHHESLHSLIESVPILLNEDESDNVK